SAHCGSKGDERKAATNTNHSALPPDGDNEHQEQPPKTTLTHAIVLHHGFMDGESILAFKGIRDHIRAKGISVLQSEVSSANTIEFRAAQLKEQIETFRKQNGFEKVNIIAHSMGGLDARYLISTLGYGEQVASL